MKLIDRCPDEVMELAKRLELEVKIIDRVLRVGLLLTEDVESVFPPNEHDDVVERYGLMMKELDNEIGMSALFDEEYAYQPITNTLDLQYQYDIQQRIERTAEDSNLTPEEYFQLLYMKYFIKL